MINRNILVGSIFLSAILSFIYGCQNQGQIEQAKYTSNGKDLYGVNCQNCHGANGEGLGDLVPPLTDTLFLKQHKTELACIIKNGISKPLVINGKTYDSKMPGLGHLEDIDIAQIITYITNNFGNKQGAYPYQKVAIDLKNCN